MNLVVELGRRFQLHNNAPGKLLLAHLPKPERESAISRLELEPSTSRTLTSKEALREECDKIVSLGYSKDHAEADEGIHCVAAPNFGTNGSGVVGTLWVSGPAKRLPVSRFRELGAEVKTAGEHVSQRIALVG